MKLLRSRVFHFILLGLLLVAVPVVNLQVIRYAKDRLGYMEMAMTWYDLSVGWVCTVLFFSCVFNVKDASDRMLCFNLTLWTVGMLAVCEAYTYAIDAIPNFAGANMAFNTVSYAGSALMIYLYWRFIMADDLINTGDMQVAEALSAIGLLVDILFVMLNLPFGYIFTVGPTGRFVESSTSYFCYLYPLLQMLLGIWAVWRARGLRPGDKVIMTLFPLAPFVTALLQVVTGRVFSLCMSNMVGALMTYGFIYTKRGRALDRDTLTGVGSVTAFNRKLADTDRRLRAGMAPPFALIRFDVNCLKQVNDALGHDAGDEYLRRCCRDICMRCKHSPVYRTGGDEFVAFLEGEDYENRREIIRGMNEFMIRQKKEPVATRVFYAFGLADYAPLRGGSSRSVLNEADKRMYITKAGQKSR